MCFIAIENLDVLPEFNPPIIALSLRVSKVSKGGKEIQNMIAKTWSYRPQKYQLVLKEARIDTFIQDKIMAFAKFIVDNFGIIVPKNIYDKYNELRKDSYKSYLGKLDFAKAVYKDIITF